MSVDAKFDCPDSARQIMTETFASWLKQAGVEVEGEVDSYNLDVRVGGKCNVDFCLGEFCGRKSGKIEGPNTPTSLCDLPHE